MHRAPFSSLEMGAPLGSGISGSALDGAPAATRLLKSSAFPRCGAIFIAASLLTTLLLSFTTSAPSAPLPLSPGAPVALAALFGPKASPASLPGLYTFLAPAAPKALTVTLAAQRIPPPALAPSPSPLPPLLAATFCENVGACSAGGTCNSSSDAPFSRVDPSRVAIDKEGGCHWAKLAGFENASICTHHSSMEMISQLIHARGTWLTPEEYDAFKQVACSAQRPFMLDVGSNIGSYSVPAAALGCHVVAFDPVMANLGRVVESVRRLGALENATFFNNFVGATHTHRGVQSANSENMGGMSFLREPLAVGAAGAVAFAVLDEMFEWEGRPVSPRTGRPFAPSEVGFLKVDAEGCDLEVLYGAQRLLQQSPVPFVTIEFSGDGNCLHKCSGRAFVDFMYARGYAFIEPYRRDSVVIPLERAPGSGELWLVHKSAALPLKWSKCVHATCDQWWCCTTVDSA